MGDHNICPGCGGDYRTGGYKADCPERDEWHPRPKTARVGDRIHKAEPAIVGIPNVAMCGTIFIPKQVGAPDLDPAQAGVPHCYDCLVIQRRVLSIQMEDLDKMYWEIERLLNGDAP